ncbi:MAG TPA: alpha/beta fold hydrolase [Methylomirabilota bacterium]
MARRRLLICLALAAAAAGCASPARTFAQRAAGLGMERSVVRGGDFDVVVFRRARTGSSVLHVYLDGDGTPWRRGGPSRDPTPRNALVLDLMRLDVEAALYLGRPCYHGATPAPPCDGALWTDARYSETVVASMAAALRTVLDADGVTRVAWFGYSGGGTLALLLAPRFPETVAVVTIAANLDIDAWADLHRYDRLAGSLNPARAPTAAAIPQRHYAGGRDRVVPPSIVARGPIPPGTLTIVPGYDHTCCWTELWPMVLAEVGRLAAR